ncbi:hypothetical protein [Phytobacter sp. SCO41]|uniref:Uncharacterized protein n=1 Tax=Citrobacter bitternis TaxID=1585982 RepID=A0ABW1Q0D3_9ENTR|nr:hypothetical protein [Phytobacter sp. SCO41]
MFYQTTFNEMSAAAEKTPPTKAQCDSFAVAIVQRQQQEQHNYQQQQQALSQSLQTLHNRCRKPPTAIKLAGKRCATPTDFIASSAGQRSTRYLIGG